MIVVKTTVLPLGDSLEAFVNTDQAIWAILGVLLRVPLHEVPLVDAPTFCRKLLAQIMEIDEKANGEIRGAKG